MQLSYRALTTTKSSLAFKRASSLQRCNRTGFRCYAIGSNLERGLAGEDFGARDPTAGEIESNFSDKVLFNWDTEHIIKPPDRIGEIMGLKVKKCVPCEAGAKPLDEPEVNKMRLQCPGWRVVKNAQGNMALAYDWTLKDFSCGLQLVHRIAEIAEAEGHHPDVHLTENNKLVIEMTTHVAGGLTENDFIMAAKINELEVADLLPKRKPKFWA